MIIILIISFGILVCHNTVPLRVLMMLVFLFFGSEESNLPYFQMSSSISKSKHFLIVDDILMAHIKSWVDFLND